MKVIVIMNIFKCFNDVIDFEDLDTVQKLHFKNDLNILGTHFREYLKF